MLKAKFTKHTLEFKRPSGTSRGVLKTKDSWFLIVWDEESSEEKGIGECSIIEGLSPDDMNTYMEKLQYVCKNIEKKEELLLELADYPSIQFGLETALLDLKAKGSKKLLHSHFIKLQQPIAINGLIWMGEKDFMLEQIQSKIDNGFRCIKLKIGAINFEEELNLLRHIRKNFDEHDIELRVDANGAFSPEDALDKLKQLAELDLHSIEQPIKQGQIDAMAELCKQTPLPIALDEELIGITKLEDKKKLLEAIQPQYIILKPSLIGGLQGTKDWINVAGEMSIPWWITSALESNIGLNAIAQFTSTFFNPLPQGLGTGQLYTNNIDSPLEIKGDQLFYNPDKEWDLSLLS